MEEWPQWLRTAAAIGTTIGAAITIIFAQRNKRDLPEQAGLDAIEARIKDDLRIENEQSENRIRHDMEKVVAAVRQSAFDQLSSHERECNVRYGEIIQRIHAVGIDIAVIKALMQEREREEHQPRRSPTRRGE